MSGRVVASSSCPVSLPRSGPGPARNQSGSPDASAESERLVDEVDLAAAGEEALRLAAQHAPDAVVLDLGLPGIAGLDVIEGLRGWTDTPIVVLSARDAQAQKVAALDAGADDYVTKPFGMEELLARLRVALRRATRDQPEAARIETADFVIDLATKKVTTPGDGEVRLTPTEWHLVEVLARHTGKLVAGSQLLQEVWGPEVGNKTNYLRVHLAHIRRKLEPNPRDPAASSPNPGSATASRPSDVTAEAEARRSWRGPCCGAEHGTGQEPAPGVPGAGSIAGCLVALLARHPV